MPNHKIENPLDKKVPDAYSVTVRTKYGFRDLCRELDKNPSNVVEELMKSFIQNHINHEEKFNQIKPEGSGMDYS